ncbi:MAG: hypothetical protein KDK40_02435 [Chlamydiia bacterium]|nr:hypothetical protein [Chlamydiia bacterium]
MEHSLLLKTKLCASCEGNIPLDADSCPYCGHGLVDREERLLTPIQKSPSISSQPPPPFNLYVREPLQSHPSEQEQHSSPFDSYSPAGEMIKVCIPLFGLLFGSLFTFFGIILSVFSVDGTLTLSWSASNATPFLLLGIPALIIGIYFLLSVDDSIGD